MDKKQLDKLVKMTVSSDDAEALRGLHGLQKMFRQTGTTLEDVLRHAAQSAPGAVIDHVVSDTEDDAASFQAPAAVSGVPECRAPGAGLLEIVPPGQPAGAPCRLPGESARYADAIALHLKDVLVAAVINKSRFRLKLKDVKNGQGVVVETVLQAEYERPGMVAIQIWINNRGEVGALASVLRQLVANTLPELMAA